MTSLCLSAKEKYNKKTADYFSGFFKSKND